VEPIGWSWSTDLTVEVAGHGVVSHAGSAVLRLLANNSGLTGALSKALRRRGYTPVHDRGRVLVDTAVCIADGGRVLSDLAALRDQGELYGPAGGVGPDVVAGAGGDRCRPARADRNHAGEDPPPGVGVDRGPTRRHPPPRGWPTWTSVRRS
jgi:hypothetical protein